MADTIIDFPEKGKGFWDRLKPFYFLLLILVIGSIFFALGRLSALEKAHTPIKIETISEESIPVSGQTAVVVNASGSGEVIGSKSGKKYYFPWCGTVKRIKPENQVHFASIEAARSAGFIPGGNCKGLK